MKHEIFNQYVDKVAKLFRVEREDLFAKDKRQEMVDARFLLYYLCASRPMKVSYIQKYMNDNGYSTCHSTIVRSLKVVEQRMADDIDYIHVIKSLASDVSI